MIENNISGFLVDPGNDIVLAEKVAQLLQNQELRAKFENNAYRRIENNFSKLDIDQIHAIYDSLLT